MHCNIGDKFLKYMIIFSHICRINFSNPFDALSPNRIIVCKSIAWLLHQLVSKVEVLSSSSHGHFSKEWRMMVGILEDFSKEGRIMLKTWGLAYESLCSQTPMGIFLKKGE